MLHSTQHYDDRYLSAPSIAFEKHLRVVYETYVVKIRSYYLVVSKITIVRTTILTGTLSTIEQPRSRVALGSIELPLGNQLTTLIELCRLELYQ
jgi:hypothetical protein